MTAHTVDITGIDESLSNPGTAGAYAPGACRERLPEFRALLAAPAPPLANDLLTIATAIHHAASNVPRPVDGERPRISWPAIAVREPGFWQECAADIACLAYLGTGHRVQPSFELLVNSIQDAPEAGTPATSQFDCVSLHSDGLSSAAGAAMLLGAGAFPLFLTYRVGEHEIHPATARRRVSERDALLWTEGGVRVTGQPLVYLSFSIMAASSLGVREVLVPHSGVLAIGLPPATPYLWPGLVSCGHPAMLNMLEQLCQRADLTCTLRNPFIYQTPVEVVETMLKPGLCRGAVLRSGCLWTPREETRRCGGCPGCLHHRLAVRGAGLPDQEYRMDVLERPLGHAGTQAFRNLIGLLTHVAGFLRRDDAELIRLHPELLSLPSMSVHLPRALAMYRRHAQEVRRVVRSDFPQTAAMLELSPVN